jgi:speckle-type POZ protein
LILILFFAFYFCSNSTHNFSLLVGFKMAEIFNWFRPGYELVTVKLLWNVQVPFLQTKDGKGQMLFSSLFSPQETPNSKWQLDVIDRKSQILINTYHCDYTEEIVDFVEPVQLKMSILNKRGKKVLQKMLQMTPNSFDDVEFFFSKKEIIESECQQPDGSLTFNCKILTHMKKKPTSSSADPSVFTVDCSGGLSAHLDGLFNNMQFSDVILNIRGREFPAHQNILATRSKVFAAMFQYPTKENLTNKIEIQDIEPEVFQELLRFIYTGRLSITSMETMATRLFIAADKYLLEELKMKCENYLVHHMSPNNCVVLLLHGDLQNPAEPLKEAAKFLRRFPNEVMATDGWKKIKQENPALLCDIQQFAFCFEY